MTKFHTNIHAHLDYSQEGYEIISYFRSAFLDVQKTTVNAVAYVFGSNFNGAEFCLAQPIGWLLVMSMRTKLPFGNIAQFGLWSPVCYEA